MTAELPLMVRPTAPRFLNFGDRAELPVVVQNNGDTPLDVGVVVESANLGADIPAGGRVTVPANERVEVRFPIAAEEVGRGALRVTAVSGDRADSATVSLPVYTPATSETFATYGELDGGAIVQPVLAPTDVIPQFGGLEVSTSSTTLQTLADAVLYLTDYRYASSDGLASQLLGISSLRDVLDAFDTPELPSVGEIDAAMNDYIAELTAMQNDDGGFQDRGETEIKLIGLDELRAETETARAARDAIRVIGAVLDDDSPTVLAPPALNELTRLMLLGRH